MEELYAIVERIELPDNTVQDSIWGYCKTMKDVDTFMGERYRELAKSLKTKSFWTQCSLTVEQTDDGYAESVWYEDGAVGYKTFALKITLDEFVNSILSLTDEE